MIKLRLQPSGAPEQIVQVEADALTIGRTPGCDVVINQPYLSKRHVRILRGLVVVDLGSSNGTFIDGERLREATLLKHGRLTLGNNDLLIEVEASDVDSTAASSAPTTSAKGEQNNEAQQRSERLSREADERKLEFVRVRAERDSALRAASQLREEIERLRAERLAAPPTPAPATSDALLELTKQNSDLKRRIAALEVGGPPQQGSSASVSELENRSRVLQREVERLQASLAARTAAPPVPAVAPARVVAGPGSGVTELLRTLMNDDIGSRAPLLRGPADEFVVLEQFRFLRSVERVVTRMAAEFIQLYQAHTVLPDTEGNFRGLATAVFSEPASEAARQELVKYMEELGKWLVVALAAHRQAAARFAEQLKNDLSERSLTGEKAVGAFAKLAGKGDAELWRRASTYLRELTPDIIDDRLEKLARDAAGELLDKPRGA